MLQTTWLLRKTFVSGDCANLLLRREATNNPRELETFDEMCDAKGSKGHTIIIGVGKDIDKLQSSCDATKYKRHLI